jgi:hypothetical protein
LSAALLWLGGKFGVGDPGDVALGGQDLLVTGSAEISQVDASGQVGRPHAVAGQVEGDADAFLEVGPQDFGCFPLVAGRVYGSPIDGVAARRVAAVGPVQRAGLEVQLEVDGLRQQRLTVVLASSADEAEFRALRLPWTPKKL